MSSDSRNKIQVKNNGSIVNNNSENNKNKKYQ